MTNFKRSIRKRFNRQYVLRKFGKWLGNEPNEPGTFRLPQILAPEQELTQSKLLVFVTPFYGLDASSVYSDFILREFKRRGFRILAIVYDNSDFRPKSPVWDEAVYIKSQHGSFGIPKSTTQDGASDRIDDWAGDDLVMYVAAVSAIRRPAVCISNYVFFSKVLTVQPATTVKILLTHDIFAERNERILAAGGSKQGWYFSTTSSDEAKGVARADVTIAIQEKEAAYFAQSAPSSRVVTLPYCLDPVPRETPKNDIFTIGYLASGHFPNVDAVVSLLRTYSPDSKQVRLKIGGTICHQLAKVALPDFVSLAGTVPSSSEFYKDCDVAINPDLLESGLKIKCVEALSLGIPLICTRYSSIGLSLTAPYHNVESIPGIGLWCDKIQQDPKLISEMAIESNRAYSSFLAKYSVKDLISIILRLDQKNEIDINDSSRTQNRNPASAN